MINNFLLNLHPALAILLITFVYSSIFILLYSLFTDQKELRVIKKDLSDLQKQIKSSKSNPKAMMQLQSRMLEKNMQYTKKSMKSLLVTAIPVLFIFSYLRGHFDYEPISPGSGFNLTATFNNEFPKITGDGACLNFDNDVFEILNAKENKNQVTYQIKTKNNLDELDEYYILTINGNCLFKEDLETISNKKYLDNFNISVFVTNAHKYANPLVEYKIGDNKNQKVVLSLEMNKLKIFGDDFSIFGFKPGWLSFFTFLSFIFNLLFRKIFHIV
jgi:uncharacterized membrane protein (DUF106 family)